VPDRIVEPDPPRVLLVVEGCYPVAWGGVSTWCDSLIRALPDITFHVLAIVATPGLPVLFETPGNVAGLTTVPLWNLHEISESWPATPLLELRARRARTTDAAVRGDFLPPLRRFVHDLLAPEADLDRLARDIHALHRFLVGHDLGVALRHPAVWDMLVAEAGAARRGDAPAWPELRLWEVTTAFQWLTRWLFPIAAPLPEVDVVHLAMAGPCSMTGIAAKLEHRAGLLLTEHGVYLRERYLAESDRRDSEFLKALSVGFALRMTQVTYRMADQISPCCDYNQRWELRAGADPALLETIYYGIEVEEFPQAPWPTSDRPTVVWVGRINPLKDVETLLRAAAVVARARPDVRFRLYGSAPTEDADYLECCLALHAALGLEEVVEFAGYTRDPAAAYAAGDLVVMSSVSEGFPYSILEAMFCGRPVVATAVGGIPEQLGDTGITVEPRSPEALGDAILRMLADPDHLRQLGSAARARATTVFPMTRFAGLHRTSYLSLSPRHPSQRSALPRPATPACPVDGSSGERGPSETGAPVEGLVEELRELAPQPVDALQLAAVVESVGITDATAQSAYGATDTFALAESAFAELQDRPVPARALRTPGSAPAHSRDLSSLDTARVPWLTLVPTIALLVAIAWVSGSGNWTPTQVLALVTGITTGMICTTGLALALVRRGSTLVSLGKLAALRRFVLGGVVAAVSVTAGVALAIALPDWPGLAFAADEATTFVGAALVLSVVWTLATCLSLVAAGGWTGVALLSGVAAGSATDLALPDGGAGLAAAVAVAVAVAVGVMVLALGRGLAREIGPEPSRDRTLPGLGYLTLEGLPYAAYGTVAVLLFFAIHVIGGLWLGYGSPDALALELGLFLPLVPSLLALGTSERLMRAFWARTRTLQHTLVVDDAARFRSEADAHFREGTRRFLISLGWLSVLTAVVAAVLLRVDSVTRLVPAVEETPVRILFVTSLAAYAVFSWAQFNGTYCLALQEWRSPVRAAAAGLVVTVVAAFVVLSTIGYAWLALALGLGSAVYGVGPRVGARQVLATADHGYASTV
jgi:polysaccharide biosynthesis protein PelF